MKELETSKLTTAHPEIYGNPVAGFVMSIRGAAREIGCDESTIRNGLQGAGKGSQKLAEIRSRHSLVPAGILSEDLFHEVVEYFAFSAKNRYPKAAELIKLWSRAGRRAWFVHKSGIVGTSTSPQLSNQQQEDLMLSVLQEDEVKDLSLEKFIKKVTTSDTGRRRPNYRFIGGVIRKSVSRLRKIRNQEAQIRSLNNRIRRLEAKA